MSAAFSPRASPSRRWWAKGKLLVGGFHPVWFVGWPAFWLWFTVLFANFAEARAEGRGKAQAAALRQTRRTTLAKQLKEPRFDAPRTEVASTDLRKGDFVLVEAGDTIPGDGEVVEGVASVNEAAVTGESAPVIRESGGDRSSVTGGTQVLSDWLVVRIIANPGETFLDRMISLVEGAKRQKTPNEIALSILLAGLTLVFLMATVTLLPFSIYSVTAAGHGTPVTVTVLTALLVCLIPTTIGGLLSAIGIAGMDRMIQANVIATFRPRRRGGGGRRRAAARQDRHHHARQPAGLGLRPRRGRHRGGARGRRAACLARRRDARGAQHRGARQGACYQIRERDITTPSARSSSRSRRRPG